MILEDTPKGFRIDWEYYVQYNPMNWSTFLKEMPAPPMDFRVYANLAPTTATHSMTKAVTLASI